MSILVRRETPEDYAAVRRLNERAFEGPTEAELVERLRDVVDSHISLVAVENGRVIAHILFTPVEIEGVRAMGLAPMAVLPDCQRRGAGTALVYAGLEACRELDVDAVVVLGHPDYYPRFGFRPAGEFGLRCEFEAPPEAFMVLELRPGALNGARGTVRYAAAFREVE